MLSLPRVALSASYWMVPVVQETLRSCDLILTSNHRMEPELTRLFGAKVRCVSCVRQWDAMENRPTDPRDYCNTNTDLYTLHVPFGAVTITFGGLRAIIKQSLLDGCQETAKQLTNYCGWEKSPQLLYDEEGIEGHVWTSRSHPGKEYTEIDDDVPAEVIASMARSF